MLYEEKELDELYYMKHRHDSGDKYIKYDEMILKKTTSPYMYKNNTMNDFLIKIQPLVSLIFDHINIVKNLKNYMINKYDYRQL